MRAMSMRSLPMPMIMACPAAQPRRGSGTPLAMALRPHRVHQRAHPFDRTLEAAEDRLADEEVPDIELDDGRDGSDRPDRVEAEPVPGMALEPDRGGVGGGI